jgi:hypothetical protein
MEQQAAAITEQLPQKLLNSCSSCYTEQLQQPLLNSYKSHY